MSTQPVSVTDKPQKTILDVAKETGRYSIDAFEFLREGLDYTVQKKHGPAVEDLRKILEWLEEASLEAADLRKLHDREELPDNLMEFIEKLGGVDAALAKLNLHVDAAELCWGLRDLALERWGLMAPTVLGHWGIRSTMDFGKMVFALVDNGLLQKQPDDHVDDFNKVYDFQNAFDSTYRIDMNKPNGRKE